MRGVDIAHGMIPLTAATLPLWPTRHLKYCWWLPLPIYLVWIKYEGCPITNHTHAESGGTFMHDIYKRVFPNISERRSEIITNFLPALITSLAAAKVMYS